ncbi:MAG: acyl carrier protein [Enhygromyxa sp.]
MNQATEREQVKSRIKRILSEVLDIVPDQLSAMTGDDSLTERFGLNSVDALEVLLRMEQEFEIEIDDDDLDLELIRSVDTLTEHALGLLTAAKAGEQPASMEAPQAK